MNRSDRFLQRLAAAAKQDDASPPDELPVGLATGVLARFHESPAPSLWESFALAALPVAAAVAMVCVVLGSPAAKPPDEAEMISNLMLETELPTLSER